ncbi:patatin-like phospholipase family protein [Kangiella sediminilitoris]|uniref:Patatin n=1 Tax=Kangiella sediminilitoris TaxID=1144748 RepID=A0A1B3B8H3_9GAMM|nr:patatin-like phospholipase family protein [Kangiella sediminilitoris]AOE49102.1 patatin [Kangiella sediminilitoris]
MHLIDWLHEEPFTLSLSSGFFSFYAHTGVLKALEENGVLPRKLTGSSAGALVASCWASGVTADSLKDILFDLKREDFWDPGFGWGLLKGKKFRGMLEDILPVKSFEECRTKLALSAYDTKSKSTIVLDSGELVPAIYASCAIPVMFQPLKYNGYNLLDGGIKDRPAMAAIRPGERVFYHHIVSVSPWRAKGSEALKVPQNDNMSTLAIHDLPRVGPTRLENGAEAFFAAYETTKKALNTELIESQISMSSKLTPSQQ